MDPIRKKKKNPVYYKKHDDDVCLRRRSATNENMWKPFKRHSLLSARTGDTSSKV